MSFDKMFPALCVAHGLPKPTAEFRFHPIRKFRYDWAWPDKKLALEVDGGQFKPRSYVDKRTGQLVRVIGGRHNSGSGLIRDIEKRNLAACLGWRILSVQPKELCTVKTLDMIKEALSQ